MLPVAGGQASHPTPRRHESDPTREEIMKMQLATLAFGLATLASVAPAQAAHGRSPAVADTSADAVTVQNDRKVPVTIYIEYGVFDRRLGIVPALQTATLPLPAWAVRGHERVQLSAHPEGEVDDLSTQELTLRPPGRLGMLIPPRGAVTSPSPTDTMSAVIPPEELADATLTVDNPRATAVTVFADQDPFDVRLGQVPAHSRVTLRFPKSVILPGDAIQIIVHPEGAMDLASELLPVRRGEHLGLRVPSR
jgi:hypothetical protein